MTTEISGVMTSALLIPRSVALGLNGSFEILIIHVQADLLDFTRSSFAENYRSL